MITDFPEVKRKLEKELGQFLRIQVRENMPIASSVNTKTFFEGDMMGILYANGEHVISRMKEASSEFSVKNEEIPNISSVELMSRASKFSSPTAEVRRRLWACCRLIMVSISQCE